VQVEDVILTVETPDEILADKAAALTARAALKRSGCSGFFSEIWLESMPKSRLRVFFVVSNAVSMRSLNSTSVK